MKRINDIEKAVILLWLFILTILTICNCVLICGLSKSISRIMDFIITNI